MTGSIIADKWLLWGVILGLGLGTFLLRFSFLGLIGNRPLPPLVLRMLRYTPVAVIPGLIAPAVVWPPSAGGATDPLRMLAAAVAVAVGVLTRSATATVAAGAGVLIAGIWLGF